MLTNKVFNRRLLLSIVILSFLGCKKIGKESPTAVDSKIGKQHLVATSLPKTSASGTIYTDPNAFQTAIAGLGTPTVIDFEDIDASPVNNTFVGRDPFDGNTYAKQGIIFSNPNAYLLYIAPGGLFWNASNSLSIRQFPFDDNAADDTDDDLVVSLDPPAKAVGLTLVDNGSQQQDEFIQFIDPSGDVVEQVGFPSDFTSFRAFIGIVSEDIPIASINIVEAPNDGDDVDYDDFIFIPAKKVTICHKPGTPAQKTLVIPIQALAGHLGHGDEIGACCVATTGAEYVISGGTDPSAGIFVDDILRVFVNGVLVAEVSQGGRCCPPVTPIRFVADTGDILRVQAQDANNCYSLEALWLQKADGSCLFQLTGDIFGPNCGSEPPEQIFFDQTFTLP